MSREQRLQNRKKSIEQRRKEEYHKKRKDAPKKQTVIQARKREQARKRREKIKNDPQKNAEAKKREHERYLKRKSEGKLKPRAEMGKHQKRLIQRKNRAAVRRHRAKKKEECQVDQRSKEEDGGIAANQSKEDQETSQNIVSLNVGCDVIDQVVVIEKTPSLKVLQGKQIQKKNRAALRKQLKEALDAKDKLQKKVWRQQKKIQKLKPQELTPRSKVNKFLKGKKVDREVKRRLQFGEVLAAQIKENLKSTKSLCAKKTFCRIMTGPLIKRYKMQKHVSGFMAIHILKSLRKRKEDCEKAPKKSSVSNGQKVKEFFERGDVSAECPDSKGFVVKFGKNRMKKRKRYLLGTLSDLYQKYREEVDEPLSFTTFCRLKPFYVVHKQTKERNTCLCQLCENTDLLIKALNKAKLIEVTRALALTRTMCCENKTEDCLRRACTECASKIITFPDGNDELEIKYLQWKKISEERVIKTGETKTVQRTVLVPQKATVSALKQDIGRIQNKYLTHVFRDWHQFGTLKKVRQNLSENELYIVMDFSQNYVCKYAREVQSHFYGASKTELTLHTGVVYAEKEEDMQSFCTVSESSRHDPAAIVAHLIPILKKTITPKISRLNFQSDSPTTQYRNKSCFYLITQFLPEIFPQIETIYYNFSEAGHGKDVADAISGCTKSTLDAAVQNGRDANSLETVVAILKEKCQKIFVDTIGEAQIAEVHTKIPKKLDGFKGTMGTHQYSWKKEPSPCSLQFGELLHLQPRVGMLTLQARK